jgi:hypothetical protein
MISSCYIFANLDNGQQNRLDKVRDPFTCDDYRVEYDSEFGTNIIIYSNGQKDYFYDVHGNPIDALEFLELLSRVKKNATRLSKNGMRGGTVPGDPNSAVIFSDWETFGSAYQVSPWAQNDYGGVTVTVSTSVTSYYSVTVNVGTTGLAKIISTIIDAGLEFNYQSSSETGVSLTFNVPLHTRGCVYFTPIFRNYDSMYIDYDNNGHSTIVTTPEKVGAFTNGIYRLVTADPI